MRYSYCIFFTLLLAGISCKRKSENSGIKTNLENALATQLRSERPVTAPPLQFTILDVTWFEESDHYDCEFKVRLHRPDGTDTTGLIKGTVSKDFTHVSKR